MKVRSTMTYKGEPIADCEWELDDRARTVQQALAAIAIEDHLRAELKIEHEIVKEEPEPEPEPKPETEDVSEDQPDTETSESSDQSVQSDEDREYNGMADWSDVDEDRS